MKLFFRNLFITVLFLFSTNFFFATSPAGKGIIGVNVDKKELVKFALQKQFDGVGSIKQDGKIIASCILIAPQWCLTAAHVFDDRLKLKSVLIEINGITYKGVKKIIHNRYKKDNVDIALIYLDKAINDVEPATIYTGSNELHSVSTFVGYGAFGTPLKPDMDIDNKDKIAGVNIIDQIGGSIPKFSTYPSHFLLEDLDNPFDTNCCNSLGSPRPLPLEYIPTGGDSGGGLFIEENGQWFLVGVFSEFEFQLAALNKTGLYGTVAAFTRVSLFNDWIKNNLKK